MPRLYKAGHFDKGFGDIAAPRRNIPLSLDLPFRQVYAFSGICSSSQKIFDFSGTLRLRRILMGVWGAAPIGFSEGEKPTPPGSGCDPPSKKLVGSQCSKLHIVCNVNNNPKLLPTERNRARRTGIPMKGYKLCGIICLPHAAGVHWFQRQSLYQNFVGGLGRSPNRFPRRGKPTALGAEAASATGRANNHLSIISLSPASTLYESFIFLEVIFLTLSLRANSFLIKSIVTSLCFARAVAISHACAI